MLLVRSVAVKCQMFVATTVVTTLIVIIAQNFFMHKEEVRVIHLISAMLVLFAEDGTCRQDFWEKDSG